jgi:hypothetical protein
MKKTLAAFVTVLFVTSSFPLPANAAAKVGGICPVLGKVVVVSGNKLLCSKSGKKFLWRKSAAVAKPLATPTPTTSASATEVIDTKWYAWSFRVNNDGVLERKQGGTNTWTVSPTRKGQLVSATRIKAFNEIKAYQKSVDRQVISVNFFFSSNVDPGVEKAFRRYFNESIDFFSARIPTGTSLDVLIATEKDDSFRKETLLKILGNAYEAEGNFNKDQSTFQQFNTSNPLNSSGGGSVSGTSDTKKYLYTGAVCSCFASENLLMYNVAHEVTHFYQFSATPTVKKQNFTGTFPNLVEGKIYIPSTLIEGSANTLGSALNVDHVGWYSDQMDWHLGRYKRNGLLKSIGSESEAVKLMKTATTYLPESTGFEDLHYVIGQLQFEFFIAKYGMKSYFDLFDNIQQSGDFDSAMKKILNISESDFYSAAAEYVMQAYNSVTS